MSSQLVHLPVAQGMGWMPLLVLAQLRLSWAVLGVGPAVAPGEPGVGAPSGGTRAAGPWVVLLAAMVGLVALTGEPRSMVEAEVVGVVVTAWLVLRPYGGAAVTIGRRAAFLGLSAVAAIWGAALAAVQLIPGWSFINASQRASESYTFFGTGSLHVSWSILMLVPDLFGGDGVFNQPSYFNSYNLPEVTAYVGLLPLVALAALLVRSFGRRRDPRSSDWGLWLVLAGLGLVMAWGEFTPLGHLFVHIPLFGKTRLQSRNLGLVDLALAMLLAFWADRMLRRQARADGGWRRWVAAAPPVAAAATCVAALVVPVALEEKFGADPIGAALGGSLAPWFVAQLVISVAAVALLFGWRRLSRSGRQRALTGLVVADIALFMLSTSTGLCVGAAHRAAVGRPGVGRARSRRPVRHLRHDGAQRGRPQPDRPARPERADEAAERPGVRVDRLRHVRHGDRDAHPRHARSLRSGDGRLHAAPAGHAARPAPVPGAGCHRRRPGAATAGRLPRRAGRPGRRRAGRSTSAGPSTCRPPRSSGRPARSWPALGRPAPGRLAGVIWAPPRRHPRPDREDDVAGRVGAAHRDRLVGAVRRSRAGDRPGRWPDRRQSVSDTSIVNGTDGQRWALDGILQPALGQSGWRYTGNWTSYGRFARTTVRPPVWVAGSPPGAEAHQVGATDWGSAVDQVTATAPVTVVRSETYMPGWHVEAVPASRRRRRGGWRCTRSGSSRASTCRPAAGR